MLSLPFTFCTKWPSTISSSNGCLCYIWPYNIVVVGSVFDIVVPWPKIGGKEEENNIDVSIFCLLFCFFNRYLPTILLLRHFDVFRNLGSHEGSPNDQVGITSEVASVIRKFSEPVTEDEDINSEGEPNDDSVRCNYLMCYGFFYWTLLLNDCKLNDKTLVFCISFFFIFFFSVRC